MRPVVIRGDSGTKSSFSWWAPGLYVARVDNNLIPATTASRNGKHTTHLTAQVWYVVCPQVEERELPRIFLFCQAESGHAFGILFAVQKRGWRGRANFYRLSVVRKNGRQNKDIGTTFLRRRQEERCSTDEKREAASLHRLTQYSWLSVYLYARDTGRSIIQSEAKEVFE